MIGNRRLPRRALRLHPPRVLHRRCSAQFLRGRRCFDEHLTSHVTHHILDTLFIFTSVVPSTAASSSSTCFSIRSASSSLSISPEPESGDGVSPLHVRTRRLRACAATIDACEVEVCVHFPLTGQPPFRSQARDDTSGRQVRPSGSPRGRP
jgi:hypothetical protein